MWFLSLASWPLNLADWCTGMRYLDNLRTRRLTCQMAQCVLVTHSDFSTCPLLRRPALATPALTQLISTPVARLLQSTGAPHSLLSRVGLPESPVPFILL